MFAISLARRGGQDRVGPAGLTVQPGSALGARAAIVSCCLSLSARLGNLARGVVQSCLSLCDPMGCSMLGAPVLHYLPEFAQTHAH